MVKRPQARRTAARIQQPPVEVRMPTRAIVAGILVASVAFALYLATAARDIVVGDTPELMSAAATLGVAHPPGYPLLTLLGHLFSLLPAGAVAFRLNLLAVVCGAATVALIYFTAWRLTRSVMASAIAALALAVNPLFWEWSLVFEAFALNNLLAALMMFFVVWWDEAPERTNRLVAAGLVGGLGFANHQTIVLLAPAVLYLMWRHRKVLVRRPRVLLACGLAFVAGLLPYASIPWAASRHPYMNWGAVSSVGDFLALVRRADYGTGQLVAAAEYQGGAPAQRLVALAAAFSVLQAILTIAGAIEAFRRARRYWSFAMLAFLVSGPGFAAYANMDLTKDSALWVLRRFFLLPQVAIAPMMAFGVLLFTRLVTRVVPRERVALATAVLAILILPVLAASVVTTYEDVDQRSNHFAGRYADDVLNTVPPRAILLASGDDLTSPVAYAQAVKGARPDVTLVMLPLTRGQWYLRHLRTRHPDLVVPAVPPGQLLTMKMLVDANPGRPIVIVGRNIDESLVQTYGYIQHGLIMRIEPVTQQFDLGTIAADNDRLLRTYAPPPLAALKQGTFEPTVLKAYAAPASWIGKRYQQAGRALEARRWYERALAIDPTYEEAVKGLAEIRR